MKKLLGAIFGVIFLLALAGYIYRAELGVALMLMAVKPEQSYAEDTRHAPPDYRRAQAWAALPERPDNADVTPQDQDGDQQAVAAADVFFIHPTTYYKPDHWNQPLDDAQTNLFTDEQVLKNQASVFNTCCGIFAPRYRQATLFSFMDDGDDGPAALALAYADIRAAFDYYLTHYNQGRPFIIAGHSQGSKHADTLLRELVQDPVMQRMVAAYPVGFAIQADYGLPVCNTPEQTGCMVTWNAVAPDAPSLSDTSRDVCVNPISWRTDGARADFSNNLGAVSFSPGRGSIAGAVEPGVADAQCVDGRLHVTEVRSDNYSSRMFGPGNYHVYDYSFFHMDIRANANRRVQAFVSR